MLLFVFLPKKITRTATGSNSCSCSSKIPTE
jgi:hypothetical protein